MRKLNYSCLIAMRENALWACEMWNAIGIKSEALRYYKILNFIEDRMRAYQFDKEVA